MDNWPHSNGVFITLGFRWLYATINFVRKYKHDTHFNRFFLWCWGKLLSWSTDWKFNCGNV